MSEEQESSQKLTCEQKIGFVLLLFFAILTVGLGVLQIRNTMYAPFALNNNAPADLKDKVNDEMSLHYRDTDLDGLSDFDELYVYTTSPYLVDSDSDGLEDKKEVDLGKDPLCAEGNSECIVEDIFADSNSSSTPTVFLEDPGAAPADVGVLLSDPVQLRQMLLTAGMEQKVLDTYSDSDLIKMVDELMSTATSTP